MISEDLKAIRARMDAAFEEIARLTVEVVHLRSALSFYADADNWVSKMLDGRVDATPRRASAWSAVDDDRGRRARHALDVQPKEGA